MSLARVAAVLPRFGASLGGGAETLVRELLLAGLQAGLYREAHVLTTCANDHRTWENVLPEGQTQEDGVFVHRFPVDARDIGVFLAAERAMQEGQPLTVDVQLDWIANSVNSSKLYAFLAANAASYDRILFAPYLFGTSFWGPLIAPERSLLVPCLHNEHYAYQEIFRAVFAGVRGLIFNSAPEQELCRQIFAIGDIADRSQVVGMGFLQPPDKAPVNKPRSYFLYSGRKEAGKGLPILLDVYDRFEKRGENIPELILIGSGSIDFRKDVPANVRDLGFVSEEEKQDLMRGALALIQPSQNESFSIVMMEAWLQGTPAIVNARCAVTYDHVVRSGGGLFFADQAELAAVLKLLAADPAVADQLGTAGREYVRREYSWPTVLKRFEEALR